MTTEIVVSYPPPPRDHLDFRIDASYQTVWKSVKEI